MDTLFQRPDKINDKLYVITTIFNSARFRTRWSHYEDFAKRIEEAGAILYTSEVAFGNREFAVTTEDNPRHLRLRSKHELWLKENALNLTVARLPSDAKYIAFLDADIHFVRDDFADEILHKLQHYDFIQPFSYAHDLNSNHEITATYRSFCYSHVNGTPWQLGSASMSNGGYYYGSKVTKKNGATSYDHHPGFGLCCRKSAFDTVGGLIDISILGEADYLMWIALGQKADLNVVRKDYSAGYRKLLGEWQERAKLIRKNIGYCEGAILHSYHGSKLLRKYYDRTRLLVRTQYDPNIDLKRDWAGVYQLTDRSTELRDGIREYFSSRNEDHLSL